MASGEARFERLYQFAQGTHVSALVLGVAAALLVAVGAVSYLSISQYRENLASLERSARFLTLIHEAESIVAQAQAAQRRYLLVGDPDELARIDKARRRLDADLAELSEHAVAYSSQRQRAETLVKLIRQRFELVDATLSRYHQGGREEALERVRSGEGQRVMDAISQLVDGISDAERGHVATWRSGTDASGQRALLAILVGYGLSLAMLVLGIAVLRRGVAQRTHAEVTVGRLNAALDRNADELDRASRVGAVLSAINRAVVKVRSRQELMRETCAVAVRTGGFDLSWAGLVDETTGLLKPQVTEGDAAPFLVAVVASLDPAVPVGRGMVGRALRERCAVVVNDVQRDTPPEYLSVSRHAGYRAAVVVPFMEGDRPAGAYMVYSREPDVFDASVVKLLEDIAAHISFALTYLQQREAADRLAYYDPLTGLPNAIRYGEQLNALAAAPDAPNGERRRVAVVALGAERLGEVTESFGPEAGDAVLKDIARRLESWAAEEDGLAARLTPGIFAYARVWPDEDPAGLVDQALRCVARLGEEPYFVAGRKLSLAVRAGVATAADATEPAAIVCVNAQAALRTAREAREPVVLYAPEMNARVAARLALETQLRNAHREAQFALHYQPRHALADDALTGLEALLRWAPPRGALVAPTDFVPVLEETGLIVDVGRWIFERVIADVRMWRALGRVPPRVSINVSGVQVREAHFVDQVARLLEAAAGGQVDIELTESTIMSDVEGNIAKLRALRDMGVGIIIDDFGTGYSSLNYLVRLPITAIKIDRSFVVDIATRTEQAAVVAAMVSLARTLELRVIAEGVETRAQAAVLRALHCDDAQGFLHSPPLPAPDVAALLPTSGVSAPG